MVVSHRLIVEKGIAIRSEVRITPCSPSFDVF